MIDIYNIKNLISKKIKLLSNQGFILKKNFNENRSKKKKKFIDSVLTDLEKNHNHSWYEELFLRNKNNLDDIAIFYRGTEITYRKMFENMQKYAKSLKTLGIDKEYEIPICMSNTPELIYLLGAISMIGAKANIFNSEFDKEYITEIIDSCNSNIIFVEDGLYKELKDSISNSHIDTIFMTSLVDSLPKSGNPYDNLDKKHGKFECLIPMFENTDSKIMNMKKFVKFGENYSGKLINSVNLDDEFTITYSSGSTNSSRAKAIVHTVRSFITIGRCHDPEIQKTTSMKNFTIQAHIPTHSNTDIIASISDALMQGSKLALEPVYDKDFFIDSLFINKPNYVVATRSFWISTIKKVFYDDNYKKSKMPFLLIPFAVGEPLDVGEEKFLNKGLRKLEAGKNIVPTPISVVTMSVAGGDCEHGGIFWILFRALQSKRLSKLLRKETCGLNPFEMVDVAVLDENGNKCAPYQLGRLVANSPCTMKCYKDNKSATEKFFITDADGKVWGDCNVYSYIDNLGGIHMKGRIPKEVKKIPSFIISDIILKDTKNIMSCEVVEDTDNGKYIAHIELQPGKKNLKKILISAENRCVKKFGEDFASMLVYRIHSFNESFTLTGCGKRDYRALEEEGFSDQCLKILHEENETSLVKATEDFCEKPKIYIK